MQNRFLKLTDTVYKVLDFFPESDPLKARAKDRALAIMEHLVSIDETSGWASFQKEKSKIKLLEDIDILLGYIWMGKSQGWLNSVNCLIISSEYEKIKKEIENTIELTIKLPGLDKQPVAREVVQPEPRNAIAPALDNVEEKKENQKQPTGEITERQKKIIEFIEKNNRAQVMDLQTVLPDITKRTIRRDLDELLGAGKIARKGDFNQVFYQIS